MHTDKAMKVENLEAIGEKIAATAEEFKNQSEAMLQEGGRILRRAQKELSREFERHPVAMVVAGAAIAGTLIWLLSRK